MIRFMRRKQQKQYNIIVAYDRRRGIGINNKLPWGRSLPADLRHFRQLTTGGTVIMGRKTYESIGRPLPNRQNIVLTHTKLDSVATASSLESAFAMASEDEVFVIGGATVYAAALKLNAISRVYATEVDTALPADTVFPELDDTWRKVSEEPHAADADNAYPYKFVVYEKQPAM